MIHFVGAGSGAADLITLRGARLLRQADVILYAGSLVNPELLSDAKADCRILDTSKMTLEQVIIEMQDAERQGKSTVRLHTGDPAIYGAIREQMDALRTLGIDFDVCPGVSSLFGAAAALKAQYTLPGVSQSVIVTRMAGRTSVPERESISSLAAHGATMVIFLSAGMTEELSEQLMAGGYSVDTPAAIVYKATWEDELVVRCTVGTLHEAACRHSIRNFALITVGEFLGEEYARSKLYDPTFTTQFRKGER